MRPELEATLLHCRNLPSPPGVALRIIELAQDPSADLDATARVIAMDPALSARTTNQVKDVLAKRLRFNPADPRALRIFGSVELQNITAGITLGLKLVLSFIGVLTLAIGGVGVMNIMFVSVKERTSIIAP